MSWRKSGRTWLRVMLSRAYQVKPADQDNPQSFKVRKTKVGGYRDYFTDQQCQQLQQMVAELDPVFGYGEEPA